MAKTVQVTTHKLCKECEHNGVVSFATYVVPCGFHKRLFSGDELIKDNSKFLCSKHYLTSQFNDPKYEHSVGRLVTSIF